MDLTDFELPSPKRQKTESPIDRRMEDVSNSETATGNTTIQAATGDSMASLAQPTSIDTPKQSEEEEDVLDFLMQHVESETAGTQNTENEQADAKVTSIPGLEELSQDQQVSAESQVLEVLENTTTSPEKDEVAPTVVEVQPGQAIPPAAKDTHSVIQPPSVLSNNVPSEEYTRAAAEANGLPPSANEQPSTSTHTGPSDLQTREWETDSSPFESSSTDSSDDSSDSDDSDEADDYTLLDPYEQARILMAEDGGGGGSDDEDDGPTTRTSRPGAGLRTMNERVEDILPKPTVIVTDEMHVEELGTVEAIVENTLLIRAKTSGEYQVLESGSVLCLADRSIVGAVAETLGRVEQPLYTVRFASHIEIEESGLSEKGTKIYYVREHSTFVFTQPLQAFKGSDASNFHDEEVGDDEMEFSDDEAEAEHKRQMKLRRKGIDPDTVPNNRGRGRGRDRGGRGGRHTESRGGYNGGQRNYTFESDGNTNGATDVTMNYDDVEPSETSYTPLKRPEMMGAPGAASPQMNTALPPTPSQQNGFSNSRGGHDRGQSRSRGRGNFNNRGRGRGNYHNNSNYTSMSPPNEQQYSPQAPQGVFQYPNFPAMSYNQQQPSNFTFQPPPPPVLTPTRQNMYPNAFSPSPITPLPGSSFNFPNFPNYSPNQWPQTQVPPQQYPYVGNQNAEAIAQVQRQLEALRRHGWQQ